MIEGNHLEQDRFNQARCLAEIYSDYSAEYGLIATSFDSEHFSIELHVNVCTQVATQKELGYSICNEPGIQHTWLIEIANS